jgi:hypothetical protein
LLNEELKIDSDIQVDLENVEETPSEESSDEMLESESEISVPRVDGWEDVMMGNKKPKKEVTSGVSRERRETKYSASLPLPLWGGECFMCSNRKVKGAIKET